MTTTALNPRYQAYLNAGSPGGIFPLWNDERWAEFFEEIKGYAPRRGGANGDLEWGLFVLEHGDAYDAWLLARFPAATA